MNYCEQILRYAQGDLTADEKAAFDAHLKTCGACQSELKFLAKLDEALTPKPAPQRVIDNLFAKTTRKKSLWARLRLGWTITALAACAGVFLWVSAPAPQAFDAHELVAYMNLSADDEYVSFAQEITDMENYS